MQNQMAQNQIAAAQAQVTSPPRIPAYGGAAAQYAAAQNGVSVAAYGSSEGLHGPSRSFAQQQQQQQQQQVRFI